MEQGRGDVLYFSGKSKELEVTGEPGPGPASLSCHR